MMRSRTPTIGLRSMLLLSAILGFYLCALQLLGVQYRWLIVDATAYVEGPMMFVIANRLKVNAGYEDMFEELFRHQAHLVEGMPGFFKWELYRPLGDELVCQHHLLGKSPTSRCLAALRHVQDRPAREAAARYVRRPHRAGDDGSCTVLLLAACVS